MSTTVSRAPRRNRQFWLDHVNQWKRSGLSKAAYCQLHSINAGSFYNWSRPTRDDAEPNSTGIKQAESAPQPSTSLTFMPVEIKSADRRTEARFVHVQRAAIDVALPTDLSADQIHGWLSVSFRRQRANFLNFGLSVKLTCRPGNSTATIFQAPLSLPADFAAGTADSQTH